MADISVPSIKDVGDFASIIVDHPGPAIAAFVLLFAVSFVIGLTSKLSTTWVTVIALSFLVFLASAGGYALYRVIPGPDTDTAVIFKFKLEDHTGRVESLAINTYVGGVDGVAARYRMIFRSKDERGEAASVRVTRICPPKESDTACPTVEYSLPVWLLDHAEVQHFRNDGPGARVIVTYAGGTKSCTIFSGPSPIEKPKNYVGPDLCPLKEPRGETKESQNRALVPRGAWWLSTAWAADGPEKLQEIRDKLGSDDAKVRGEGRSGLQQAPNAAELLGLLLVEPRSAKLRDRIVVNALISAIYFGDDKWTKVTPQTKAVIRELLVDKDELVSRYARGVLRRYPEKATLEQIKTAATMAMGDDRYKLLIAASDIEYNLGVVRLRDARTTKTDMAKWTAAVDAFDAGIETGKGLPSDATKDPDVVKNFFGLALSKADKWTFTKSADNSVPQIKSSFSMFLAEINRSQYPFTEQVEAATCVVKIDASESAQFEQGLGRCLKFFR